MNKDSYLIFEAYKGKQLAEMAPPVELGEYQGTGSEIAPEFPELSKGKYDLTPEETSGVYAKFLDNFRKKGGKSPKLYKDFYEMEIAPVVRDIKPSINNTNAKYCARVLYNALKEASVLKDERDGVEMTKKPSKEGVKKLTKFTLKNAGKLDKEPGEEKAEKGSAGEGIDDPVMKRFWERILGEGEYDRDELVRMMIEDNPDMEESEAKLNVSALIRSGYIEKSGVGYKAVDPEEETEAEEKEGEGTGEVTSGYDPEDVEDFDNDPYGGVYIGPSRGDISFD